MENSEQQTHILNLGKEFVKKLDLEPGVDTFSRWMAHYIAEKMTAMETAAGKEKDDEARECYDTILKLWAHRAALPNGLRPFESFEPIFTTLHKLSPDRKESYFYRDNRDGHHRKFKATKAEKEIADWMTMANDIDFAARDCLRFVIVQAAKTAKDESTRIWIENSIELKDTDEPKAVRIIFKDFSGADLDDFMGGQTNKYEIEELKTEISKLEKAESLLRKLISDKRKQLEKLRSSKA